MRADIVSIQEPYISGGVVFYPAFGIRGGRVGKSKEQRVVIGIAVSTVGQLIVEA